jgi:electron transport complex protein RnfB
MKKVSRREILKIGAGMVLTIGTSRSVIGCGRDNQKDQKIGDAHISDAEMVDVSDAWPVDSEEVFQTVRSILDTLPLGFPATADGVEIALLKKVFTLEEAALFCDLRLTPETADQIAKRTNRPLAGLEERLIAMCKRGEIDGKVIDGVSQFALLPWLPGIYECQVDRMDKEFCELHEKYASTLGIKTIQYKPTVMRVIPIEEIIPSQQQALPYQQVSAIIEKGSLFRVNQCVCKKHRGIIDTPCDNPQEVCLQISVPEDGEPIIDWGRRISKEEAYQILDKAEKAGLVHLTANVKTGNWFICNCCGCCCAVLRGVKALGSASMVVSSDFRAEIDPNLCQSCGKCKNERCQVNAIEAGEDFNRVVAERCIGCGLCVSTCPQGAAKLVAKSPNDIADPPVNFAAWNDERAQNRGVDFSKYK